MTPEDIKQLISKAESGDIEAMYTLAVIYRDGQDVKQDFERFLHWLMCLRKRFGFSQKIKSILSFQNRPESELKSFVAWVQDSAVSGSTISINFLATLYREGIGVKKDHGQNIKWLDKAITAGDTWSMGNLAWAYKEGEGVERDLSQFIKWLQKAVAAGSVIAMGYLAHAYREGEGVEKDLKQYIKWLRKAIAAGMFCQ